jgi:hypothetical protein
MSPPSRRRVGRRKKAPLALAPCGVQLFGLEQVLFLERKLATPRRFFYRG